MQQTNQLADTLTVAAEILGMDTDTLLHVTKLGLLESAVAAPFAGFGDTEFYPDLETKGAILCSRIVRNHAFPDGNKRIGWASMRMFFDANDVRFVKYSDDDSATVIENLAAGTMSEADFVAWVKERTS